MIGLAPMDGWTDSAMRQISKKFGADLLMSEMIPAAGLVHGRRDVKFYVSTGLEKLLYFTEIERPIAWQIFGKNPQEMAAASILINQGIKNMYDERILSDSMSTFYCRFGWTTEININFIRY